MARSHLSLLLAALAWVGKTAAQSPGPANTNSACVLYGYYENGFTFFYNPSDTEDMGILALSSSCDPGSYASATMVLPDASQVDCGYFALDGQAHTISCPNTPRGITPEGLYQFLLNVGTNQFHPSYSVSHKEATVTAPTPTQTATTTPTDTVIVTEATTATDTETSSQVTVTSLSSSVTNTFTVTPKSIRTTSTSRLTITKTGIHFTITDKTVTTTAPCRSTVLAPMMKHKRPLRLDNRSWAGRLRRRDTPNTDGQDGDPPATTTTTPSATIVTQTASPVTTTVTAFTAAPDATTTVANPTPTATVFSGTDVESTTTTLPPRTRTKTVYTLVTAHTSKTRTLTDIHTSTRTAKCTSR